MSEESKPTSEGLVSFVQNEWADLHHSRVQEWTALGVVAGVHLGLAQVVNLALDKHPSLTLGLLVVAAAAIGAAFGILGILITLRHRHLMRVKLNWIFQAEEKLGLIKDKHNPYGIIPRKDSPTTPYPWRGLSAPRPLSTGGLVIGFYALLILIDALAAVFAASQ